MPLLRKKHEKRGYKDNLKNTITRIKKIKYLFNAQLTSTITRGWGTLQKKLRAIIKYPPYSILNKNNN